MRNEDAYLSIPVAIGRSSQCRIVGVEHPRVGKIDYHGLLNPNTPNCEAFIFPVQNVPYQGQRSAEGFPVEALYAMVKDQLIREQETVCPEKSAVLDRVLKYLDDSLLLLLDVNAVPEMNGEDNA